jgi:hypothetical protein
MKLGESRLSCCLAYIERLFISYLLRPFSINMDPLNALSVASCVVQLVDFSAKIVQTGKEIYQSTDGASKANAFLEDATSNLAELSAEIVSVLESDVRDLPGYLPDAKWGKQRAEQQLVKLAEESRTIAAILQSKLDQLKRLDGGGRWSAIQQGFRTVFAQKAILALAGQLELLRKQIDTALLVSLRCVQNIGQWKTC